MAQTNLETDNICSYNQSAAPFYWTFEPYQYANTYVYGEVGLNSAGGAPGSYVRPVVVDVDSFLSGRDEILSRCNPPVPSLDEVTQQPTQQPIITQQSIVKQDSENSSIMMQDSENVSIMIPKFTREKKSAINLASVDYNRWQPNLPDEPQDLRYVIEDFAPQRGGMDTTNYSKLAWNPTTKRGSAVNGPRNSCETLLDPARYNAYSASVSGVNPRLQARPLNGKPPMENRYPFVGPTSQNIKSVGATACAENEFYGPNYTDGSCGPQPPQNVLTAPQTSPGLQAFSLM